MIRANEWNGESTTLESVTVEALRCQACRAKLTPQGGYVIRVDGKAYLRSPETIACPRCRHPQTVPRLFAVAQEVDDFFQSHCGRPLPPWDVIPTSTVSLDLHRRNGSLTLT